MILILIYIVTNQTLMIICNIFLKISMILNINHTFTFFFLFFPIINLSIIINFIIIFKYFIFLCFIIFHSFKSLSFKQIMAIYYINHSRHGMICTQYSTNRLCNVCFRCSHINVVKVFMSSASDAIE